MIEIALKIMIDADNKASILLYKVKDLTELLKKLIHAVQYAFPNVRIISKPSHYHISGISNAGTFTIIKSYLEELYLRFLDEKNPEDIDSEWFSL